jgi:dihydroxyacetone kinase
MQQGARRAAADVPEVVRAQRVDDDVEPAAERGQDQRLLGVCVQLAGQRLRGALAARERGDGEILRATSVEAPSSASSAAASSRPRSTAFP